MSDELVLEEPFRTLWQGKDVFAEVEKITGNTVRALESRRTLRFDMGGQGYYLKLHHGTEFKEVVKSLIRLRLPVLGADREWNAIHRLAENGVDTMEGVAYGDRGGNPLTKTSFIITKDLAPIVNLRDYIIQQKPTARIMRIIVNRLADMVRKMHACGVNHRDCYILHFLMRTPFDGTEENLKLFIIDLHRAQLRDSVPIRWRNKDLIALLFSVRDLPFTQRDIFRFMKRYFQMSLRDIFKRESWLIQSAAGKVARIERHHMKSIHGKQ